MEKPTLPNKQHKCVLIFQSLSRNVVVFKSIQLTTLTVQVQNKPMKSYTHYFVSSSMIVMGDEHWGESKPVTILSPTFQKALNVKFSFRGEKKRIKVHLCQHHRVLGERNNGVETSTCTFCRLTVHFECQTHHPQHLLFSRSSTTILKEDKQWPLSTPSSMRSAWRLR